MPLRIGFDMDGVLADFSLAFHDVEARLFGPGPGINAGEPAREEEDQQRIARRAEDQGFTEKLPLDEAAVDPAPGMSAREARRRRDVVWRNIQSTPNFWSRLKPIDEDAVRRIHEMTRRLKWEVFFITQRPKTDGDTVQRQTQQWLVDHGFDLPSVLVLGGSRGAAAGALRLDYHIDDSAQNCLDVIAHSRAKPILIVPDNDETVIANARKVGVGTAQSIGECLDILEKTTGARVSPGLLARIATMVGWKT